jgi:hypothetical protein
MHQLSYQRFLTQQQQHVPRHLPPPCPQAHSLALLSHLLPASLQPQGLRSALHQQDLAPPLLLQLQHSLLLPLALAASLRRPLLQLAVTCCCRPRL